MPIRQAPPYRLQRKIADWCSLIVARCKPLSGNLLKTSKHVVCKFE